MCKVPEVTCVDCSPAEVMVWEELFALTRRMIEAGHETESKCKKGRKREREIKENSEEDKEKEQRVGGKDRNISSILSMTFSLLSSSAV